MADVNYTMICAAADKDAAEAIVSQFAGGAGTFSIALTTWAGGKGPTTHYAGSGFVAQEMVDALRNSSNPIIMLLPADGTDVFTQLAACDPVLHVVVSGTI